MQELTSNGLKIKFPVHQKYQLLKRNTKNPRCAYTMWKSSKAIFQGVWAAMRPELVSVLQRGAPDRAR